jgi:hypothetical protein
MGTGDVLIEGGTGGPVFEVGSLPKSNLRQSGSLSGCSNILKEMSSYLLKSDMAYKVPKILTPCRWAEETQPEGGIVTRL